MDHQSLFQQILEKPENYSDEEIERATQIARELSGVNLNKWVTCKYYPHPRQQLFLSLDCEEILVGGSCAGGKTISLLMGALQYVHVPGYAALLIRRTYSELSLEGGLIPESRDWLQETEATWNGQDHKWTFPSGATITFGYMDTKNDKYRYKSSQFQYIGFDELTEFDEEDYTYMFSRLRKPKSLNVPLRMRSGSNPGGRGHEWVKKRFIPDDYSFDSDVSVYSKDGRKFVPSKLSDNYHMSREEYEKSLSNLSPVEKARLLKGDWNVITSGGLFESEWFSKRYTRSGYYLLHDGKRYDIREMERFTTADTASTEGEESSYSVFCQWAFKDGFLFLLNVFRKQIQVPYLIKEIKPFMAADESQYAIVENKASGIGLIQDMGLQGIAVRGYNPGRNDKVARSVTAQIMAQAGKIVLPQAAIWLDAFLLEVVQFPIGSTNDQVDNLSMASLHKHANKIGPAPAPIKPAPMPMSGRMGY